MDLYIAICEDRHIDIVVRVFDTKDKAIDYAKQFVQENARFPQCIEEEEIEGWLYYCRYSSEGDSVRVEEGTLNDASLES